MSKNSQEVIKERDFLREENERLNNLIKFKDIEMTHLKVEIMIYKNNLDIIKELINKN